MSDSKKELVAELRRLADYADGIASGTATGTEEADVEAAVWFHRDQPDGDLYTALHAQIVAVCPAKIVDELEQLHANTIAAHRKVVEHDGGITCYWVNQKGKAVEQSSVPMKNGRIADGYKVVTEISEDYKCECHALAVAARNEANFIETIKDVSDVPNGKRKRAKHIPYKQALETLKRLNVPKDRKTLQRWMKGTNTPEDFTPECMHSIQSFGEWAKIYANREKSKINVNNALRIDNPKNDRMRKFR